MERNSKTPFEKGMDKEAHIEQLMMEKLTGLIGEEDACYLDGLLEKDEAVRRRWEKIKGVYERHPSGHSLSHTDAAGAWARVEEGIAVKKRARTVRMRRLAVAASIMLPVMVAALFFFPSHTSAPVAGAGKPDQGVKLYLNGSQVINLSGNVHQLSLHNVNLKIDSGNLSYAPLNDQVSHALNTLAIPATATYKITLSDGTKVWLNSVSQLKFPFAFSGGRREVWLEGEAYFEVAEDAAHPFIVHTPLTKIKVLGTAFNVNTYDSLQVKTALVEGSVNTLAVNGKDVRLQPGYEAVFSREKGFRVSTFDRDNTLSWMQGIYYFRNASLNNIAGVISRWYGDSIVFDDPRASSSRFSGAMLKDKPLKTFLDRLTITSNIRYERRDGVIHVRLH